MIQQKIQTELENIIKKYLDEKYTDSLAVFKMATCLPE